jgi:adenylate cyclase
MIRLVAEGDFCFVWRREPPQWVLREGIEGADSVTLTQFPFSIGRDPLCQLVLPESPDVPFSTSRWHCHIDERGGRLFLGDGTAEVAAGSGVRKASVAGTFLNGKRVDEPSVIASGDKISIGPWQFRVERGEEAPVDLDRVLAAGEPKSRAVGLDDARVDSAYAALPALFDRLKPDWTTDECLDAILAYALDRVPNAELAVLFVDRRDGGIEARMARQRGRGRVYDVRVGESLPGLASSQTACLFERGPGGSGLIVPLRSHKERLGALYLDNRAKGSHLTEPDLFAAHALASVATLHLVLERQAVLTRTEQNMRKYFGPNVVALILEESRKGKSVSLAVRECEATVLFVDLVNFSTACRGRTPREISDLLSPYYQLMCECIQRNGGYVDKFIGDAVLGVFGAQPFDVTGSRPDHAVQAVRAGREMLATWAWSAPSGWGAHMGLRVGINSGKVVAGNIGFSGRMEYSVIGETVNLASHMQRHAAVDTMILSQSTRDQLGPDFVAQEIGEIDVKGFGKLRFYRAG